MGAAGRIGPAAVAVDALGRRSGQRSLPWPKCAGRLGITINGLAIVNDAPYLEDYYRRNVVGGSGGFVMSASGKAIRRKLLRELAPGRGRGADLVADPDGYESF